jgi:hypothetical protein
MGSVRRAGRARLGQGHTGSVGWERGGSWAWAWEQGVGAGLGRGAPGVGRSVGPWVQVMDPWFITLGDE